MGRHLRLHPVVDRRRVPRRGRDDVARDHAGCAFAGARLRGGADADGGGFVVESAPGTPGLIGLMFPWDGRAAFRAVDARDPARGAAARDHRRPRRPGGCGSRAPVARGSTTRWRPRTALRSSWGSPTAARIAWEGGSRRMVALGTPPAWFAAARRARRPGGIRGVPGAAAGLRLPAQPGHGRVGAPDGVGARGRGAARLRVRPVGTGANGRRGTGPRRGDRAACTSATPRCSRRRSGSIR